MSSARPCDDRRTAARRIPSRHARSASGFLAPIARRRRAAQCPDAAAPEYCSRAGTRVTVESLRARRARMAAHWPRRAPTNRRTTALASRDRDRSVRGTPHESRAVSTRRTSRNAVPR